MWHKPRHANFGDLVQKTFSNLGLNKGGGKFNGKLATSRKP